MSQPERADIRGIDVPIVNLTPLRRRRVSDRDYNKLVANIRAVGLIEPLCICQEGDQYFILDGYIRYTALVDLGIETAPCLVLDSRDLYTPNRQVNNLSQGQKIRMLRQALEQLDEQTIARAFGIKSLKAQPDTRLYRDLHAEVADALKSGQILQQVAVELLFVVPGRQLEILHRMRACGDFSLPFVKSQVLSTPPAARSRKHRRKAPWDKTTEVKRGLVKTLTEVEKQYDFYSTLYRQYVRDLLTVTICARQIVTSPQLRAYLERHYPEHLKFFESLLALSEGKAAI